MMKTMADKQRGVSLSGLLIWVVLLIFAAIGAMKLVPAYIQDAEIKDILYTVAHDPEMQNAQVRNIRDSFGKRIMMNNITVINQNDIEIEKDASGLTLSVSYQMKVPLAGNVSLILEFNPNSSAK